MPILGKSLCLCVKEVLYYRGVFRDCQKLGTFGTEKAFSCWEVSSSIGRNLTVPTLTVMLGVHVRKFWGGGEHKGRQNIKNILCCFRTRQLQGRVTLMILSKLINTLLMLLKLSHGWRRKSQLSPVMTMAKMRTVHRYEIHLDACMMSWFFLFVVLLTVIFCFLLPGIVDQTCCHHVRLESLRNWNRWTTRTKSKLQGQYFGHIFCWIASSTQLLET